MANDLRGSYGTAPKQARIPALADAADSRSWYACSRSRVATGLLLTAPRGPDAVHGSGASGGHLWSDNATRADRFIDWETQAGDGTQADFHRFTRDLN